MPTVRRALALSALAATAQGQYIPVFASSGGQSNFLEKRVTWSQGPDGAMHEQVVEKTIETGVGRTGEMKTVQTETHCKDGDCTGVVFDTRGGAAPPPPPMAEVRSPCPHMLEAMIASVFGPFRGEVGVKILPAETQGPPPPPMFVGGMPPPMPVGEIVGEMPPPPPPMFVGEIVPPPPAAFFGQPPAPPAFAGEQPPLEVVMPPPPGLRGMLQRLMVGAPAYGRPEGQAPPPRAPQPHYLRGDDIPKSLAVTAVGLCTCLLAALIALSKFRAAASAREVRAEALAEPLAPGSPQAKAPCGEEAPTPAPQDAVPMAIKSYLWGVYAQAEARAQGRAVQQYVASLYARAAA